jgi:hypothetical protein
MLGARTTVKALDMLGYGGREWECSKQTENTEAEANRDTTKTNVELSTNVHELKVTQGFPTADAHFGLS